MTGKTQALVKEVAGLFVKYSLADWAPLIEELERGGRGPLSMAVRDLAATPRAPARAKSKTVRAKSKTVKFAPPAAAISFSAERTKFLEPLLRALKARVVAPTAHDMRELYLSIGIKAPYPKSRDAVAEAVAMRLDVMPEAQFRKVLTDIVGMEEETDRRSDDYARWFNLILEPNRRDSAPVGNLPKRSKKL